jgi:hypothetical protein
MALPHGHTHTGYFVFPRSSDFVSKLPFIMPPPIPTSRIEWVTKDEGRAQGNRGTNPRVVGGNDESQVMVCTPKYSIGHTAH